MKVVKSKEKKVNNDFCFKVDQLFWLFIVCSILGFIHEVLLHFLKTGLWESRSGVIYGPFNPVYGLGAIFCVCILYKVKKIPYLFLFGAILGAIFEYGCSWVQEKCFGTISWDYRHYFFNIAGRTSLFHAVCWGIIVVVLIVYIFPLVCQVIVKCPKKVNIVFTFMLCSFMIFNMSISSLAAVRQNDRRLGVPASTKLEHFLDNTYPDSFMDKIYPNKKIVADHNRETNNIHR